MTDETTGDNTSMRQFADQQIRIHNKLKQKRLPYEDLWDELCGMFTPELYLRPDMSDANSNSDRGQRFGADRWDGYPQLALLTWSRGIPGNMIYDGEDTRDTWLKMRLNVRSLMKEPEIKKYCEERTEQVFWAFRRTNFYEINPQFCRYAGNIGSYLFPMVDSENRTIEFILEDPWYVWVERDIFGKVNRIHREIQKTVEAFADEFGEDSLSPLRKKQFHGPGNDPYTEFTAIHCIFPNPQWDALNLDASRKRYVECYIDIGTRHVMKVTGLDYMPIDWAVERAPRSIYPLTPAMFALTDSYGSDVLSKSVFAVALEAADPETRASNSLRDKYNKGPGQITWIDDPTKDFIEQVRRQLSYPIPDKERQMLNNKIDWWFSVEYWRLLSNLGGKVPTAFHIQQLQSEKATLLGPQVGTYTRQVLDTGVDIVSEVEDTYEHIEWPDKLTEYIETQAAKSLDKLGYEVNDKSIKEYARKYPSSFMEAKYTGVLTAIQSQVIRTRKYGEGIQALGEMSKLWPEVVHIVKSYPLTKHILEAANWSEDDSVTPDEWKKIVEALQKQKDIQDQIDMAKTSSEAYNKMVKSPGPGSPAESATKQAQGAA